LAVAAPEHPDDGGLQVVITHATGDTAQVLKGAHVPVQKGVLGLVEIDAVEALARSR
jgi:hypothetical protein